MILNVYKTPWDAEPVLIGSVKLYTDGSVEIDPEVGWILESSTWRRAESTEAAMRAYANKANGYLWFELVE